MSQQIQVLNGFTVKENKGTHPEEKSFLVFHPVAEDTLVESFDHFTDVAEFCTPERYQELFKLEDSQPKFTLVEIEGDLFNDSVMKDETVYLAHCISSDYVMGGGIAPVFVDKFNLRESMPYSKEERPEVMNKAVLVGRVFNLITKPRVFHKPKYSNIARTLEDMKSQCVKLGITKLAMPRIGSGLDQLQWHRVKEEILKAFTGTDVQIEIYYLK